MISKYLVANEFPLPISPRTPEQASSLPALPAPLLILCVLCDLQDSTWSARPRCAFWSASAARAPSAGFATAVPTSRAAAAAASRRSGTGLVHPAISARAAGHWPSVAGSDEHVPAWQVVDADLRVRHGLCAAWRRARARRALRWRRRPRRPRIDDACARPVRRGCMLQVLLYVCLYVVKIALHLFFARLKVCTFDMYSIPTLTSRS